MNKFLWFVARRCLKALSAANVIKSVGRIEDQTSTLHPSFLICFDKLSTIEQTVLRSGKDGLVLLEDVAKVETATAPQWTAVTSAGWMR